MSRAHLLHPQCIDEHCSIDGKDVKEILRETEPSWLNETKAAASLMGLAALIAIGEFAWYSSSI